MQPNRHARQSIITKYPRPCLWRPTAIGEYELDDAALERKLFAPAGYNPPRSKPLPEWVISTPSCRPTRRARS
jgi:hypothetical protein